MCRSRPQRRLEELGDRLQQRQRELADSGGLRLMVRLQRSTRCSAPLEDAADGQRLGPLARMASALARRFRSETQPQPAL